jgi:hypothetical protein
MSIQSIGIVLHPTTGIAQPVLNVLLNNISTLFGETQLTRWVWYSVLWYGMVWYGMVWYGMVWYGMVWYGVMWYAMLWYAVMWYGMVWWCWMMYGMVWCGMYRMVYNGIVVRMV